MDVVDVSVIINVFILLFQVIMKPSVKSTYFIIFYFTYKNVFKATEGMKSR